MTKIKTKIDTINSGKLDQALWPDEKEVKNPPKKSKHSFTAFIIILLSTSLSILFSMGSIAPDISLLLFCLMIILVYYKKYPF